MGFIVLLVCFGAFAKYLIGLSKKSMSYPLMIGINEAYGFIHKALEDLVLNGFGKETWDKILEVAEIDYENGPFLSHSSYGDGITMRLILTTCKVLDLELETALEVFGGHFLVYCQHNGYDRILRVLGGNMFDMLSNLDNLHDHLDSQYPGIRAPSFKCSIDGDALILHYYSVRNGLEAIVRGLVKAIGKSFFNTEVNVSTIIDENDGHVSLRITGDQEQESGEFKKKILQQDNCVTRFKDGSLPISNRTFMDLFPFHILLNNKLDILQSGKVFLRITRSFRRSLGRAVNFTDVFDLIRPILPVDFDSFLAQVNQMYVVKTKVGVIGGEEQPIMKLKGQIVSLADRQQILFLCSPRFQSSSELMETNIFLADIPIHDHCRDMLLLNINRGDERELVQKLEEGSNKLKTLELELQDDKKRTDELLHSILPAKVAEKLRLNLPVESETFDVVSALFSDIVGFTALCSSPNIEPINIVEMLSHLYTQFDELSHSIGVYKLETIGDAYIVVGSIPDFVEDHADRTVHMGVEMIKIISKAISPADGKPLQMRIGIHTGSVMAGVVGKTMPRYCCFGNTMSLANKMESNGVPMQVTISEVTKKHLQKDIYEFESNKEISGLQSFLIKIKNEFGLEVKKENSSKLKKQFSSFNDCEDSVDSGYSKDASSASSSEVKPSSSRKSRIPVAKKVSSKVISSRDSKLLPKLRNLTKQPSTYKKHVSPHKCQLSYLETLNNKKWMKSSFQHMFTVKETQSSFRFHKIPAKKEVKPKSIVRRALPPISGSSTCLKDDRISLSIEEILALVNSFQIGKNR